MNELAVGLMSGTSLDGIDAALVRIEGETSLRLDAFHSRPYTPEERAGILDVMASGSPRSIALLHRRMGRWFADAATAVLARAGVPAREISFVASHGQTIRHEPGAATLQIGCPATIAERLGVRVVADFRSRDVAAGGQGAPLVPIADAMLFGNDRHARALVNLGGMANVTWVPRRGSLDGVLAFDTGPGVAVIDAVARMVDPEKPYDVGGRRAAQGTPVSEVVRELLQHPYFELAPPKSTGREMFGDDLARQLIAKACEVRAGATDDDCIATALQLTVDALTDQFARWLPRGGARDLMVSGGGARNPMLVRRLEEALSGWPLLQFEDEFFDGDAKEAAVFAYLGWRALHGLPGNVPSATGARGVRVLGSVTLG